MSATIYSSYGSSLTKGVLAIGQTVNALLLLICHTKLVVSATKVFISTALFVVDNGLDVLN